MLDDNKPTRKIFFNYRRADNPDFVERIRDWFAWKYGRDSVFMDFDTIPPFTAFADFIREKVRECDLLVAIIGPQWLDILRDRLAHNDEEDYVQTEIRLALEEGKPIAPICIKKAVVPRSRDLPSELRPMLEYHVAHLDSGKHFLDNIEMILEGVERELTKLDALKVMAKVQTVEFDVFAAIQNYQEAADRQDWRTALDWLSKIRNSGYAPTWYPLENYEREANEFLQLQEAEREYNIIRKMVERVSRKPEERVHVKKALEALWKNHPGYDPDGVASKLLLDVELSGEIAPQGSVEVTRIAKPLDLSIFDQLDNPINPVLVDAVFNPDTLAHIVENLPHDRRTISIEEAQSLGLLPDLENQ